MTLADELSTEQPPPERLRSSDPLYAEVLDFLWSEAELLDNDRLDEWVELFDETVRYRMPVRTSVHRKDGTGFHTRMAHFDEDIASLRLRVARSHTVSNFAEDPPSRVLRFVTNVRVAKIDETELDVRSYVLLMRSRGDSENFEMLAAERHDRLRIVDSAFKILAREIHILQSRLGMANLAVFV